MELAKLPDGIVRADGFRATPQFIGYKGMFPDRSIKALYPLALAEGEGIGTAYEYYAKRRMLAPWLTSLKHPRSMLIAGLPEKYGCSLDFLQVAEDLCITELVVVDDRSQALEKARLSVAKAQADGALTGIQPEFFQVSELFSLRELDSTFNLCLESEVLQRMNDGLRHRYVERICELAPAVGLFAPNGSNRNHTTLSGLLGLELSDLQKLAGAVGSLVQAGYVDMPPFPPGLTRSPEQRIRAAVGRLEQLAMTGLKYYACLEPSFPSIWCRHHAHIIYGFIENG
jgi:hypothetical protein